jgi:hypothetical protein
MLDYDASKTARQEHERRVRTLTPVYDHDERFTDERQLTLYPVQEGIAGTNYGQRRWVWQQIRRLFHSVPQGLSLFLAWLRRSRGISAQSIVAEKEQPCTEPGRS